MSTVQEIKTASELLMETMEDFSQSEGKTVLILYTNEDGEVVFKTNATNTHSLGLLEYAKRLVFRFIFKDEEGG